MRVLTSPTIPHVSHRNPPPIGPTTSPASSPTSMIPIILARWLLSTPDTSAFTAPHAGRNPALPPSSNSLPTVKPAPLGTNKYSSDDIAFAMLRTATVGFLPT